jgi:plastocyanin
LEPLEARRTLARSFLETPLNDAFPGQLLEHFGAGVVHSVSTNATIASSDLGVTPDVDYYQFAAAVDGDLVVRLTNQGGDPELDGPADIGLRLSRLDSSGNPVAPPIDIASANGVGTVTIPTTAGTQFFFSVSSLSLGDDANYQLDIQTRDREDDGGTNNDRLSAATNLGAYPGGAGLTSMGYTITSPDRDFFRVTIPASSSVQTFIATATMPSGSGASTGANGPTNLGLRVRNTAGAIIATSNTTETNVDTVRFEVPASSASLTYFLEVYSGSLGQVNRYDLSLVTEPRVGTISGFAYNDINGDGFRQESEPGRAGVVIELDQGNDGSVETTVTTDANGYYSFLGQSFGVYSLKQIQPPDRRRTWPEADENFAYVATLDRDTTQIDHLDFGSQQLGEITVVKVAVPDDVQDFAFTSTELGAFSLDDDGSESTSGGGLPSSQLFDLLIPGTYYVTETTVGGWDLTGLAIDDPDNGSSFNLATGVATIDVDAGEAITVTYTNTKRGSIQVIKVANPSDGTDFSFTSTIPNNTSFQLDDDADGALPNSRTFASLVPGMYTITEEELGGWKLEELAFEESLPINSSIDLDTRVATIVVDPGELVRVTFTNTKLGSIRVTKVSSPDDQQDFSFTTTGSDLSDFSLDDDGGADSALLDTKLFSGLSPGDYTITEDPVLGWELQTIELTGDDGDSSTSTLTGMATITLDPGEDITVTFTNRKRGSITVVKDANPDHGADFSFASDIPLNASFLLDDDSDPVLPNSRTFGNLIPGTYTITEAALGGWSLTDLVISEDKEANSTVNLGSGVATIMLDPGETVTVTYTNSKLGSITVIKDTQPDNGQDFTFDFAPPASGAPPAESFLLDDDANPTLLNTKTYSNLAPGVYTITEQATTGWTLDSISIDNDPTNNSGSDLALRRATINVGIGEDITVTFANVTAPLVKGVKFRDDNANGARELGEPGLAGYVIELYLDDGDSSFEPTELIGNLTFAGQDTLVGTATTDANGMYKLGVLSDTVAGRYFIRERQQSGFRETTSGLRTVNYLGDLLPLADQNFGNASCSLDFDLTTVEPITPDKEGILTLQLEGGGTFTVQRSGGGMFSAYDPTNTQTNLFTGTTLASRSTDTFNAAARVDIRVTAADVVMNTDSNPGNDVTYVVTVTGAPANARLRYLNAVNVLTSTSVFLQIRGTLCGELIAIRDDADATGASDAKRIAIGSVYGPLNNGTQPLTFEGLQYKATIINPLFGGNPAIAGIQVFADGGDDIVRVGSGVAARDITLQQSTIYLGRGNDFARVGGQRSTVFGEQGDDLVIGGAADDTIYGGLGNDRLYGSGGPDRIFGDDGNDLIGGGDGNDSQLFGGAGNDTISGGRGNDRITGDAGFDTAFRDNFDTAGVTTCETVNSLGAISESPFVDGVLRNLIDAVFDDLELSDGDEDPAIADTIDELLSTL